MIEKTSSRLRMETHDLHRETCAPEPFGYVLLSNALSRAVSPVVNGFEDENSSRHPSGHQAQIGRCARSSKDLFV